MAHSQKTTFQKKKNLMKPTHSVVIRMSLVSHVTTNQIEPGTEEEIIVEALAKHTPKVLAENVDATAYDIDVKVRKL